MALADHLGQFLRTRGFSRAVVIFLLVTVGSWVGWRLRILHAQVEPPSPSEVTATWRGFLRSDTFGWISLNCENDWNNDGILALPAENDCAGDGGEYGVAVTLNLETGEGSLTGFGWSPHLGLVCFGATCAGPDPDGALPSQATFDLDVTTAVEDVTQPSGVEEITLLTGWARVEAQAQSGGWINLQGLEQVTEIPRPAAAGGLGIVGAGVNDLTFRGTAWQRNPDGTGVGWIAFGPAPPGRTLTGGGGGGGVGGGGGGGGTIGGNSCTAPARGENTVALCTDQQDNDNDNGLNECDGAILSGRDCLDYDCQGLSFWSTTYPNVDRVAELRCGVVPPLDPQGTIRENALSNDDCADGRDNDLDAWRWDGSAYVENLVNGRLPIDCGDPDCAGVCVTNEFATGERNFCLDGEDNDGDNLVDCADTECEGTAWCTDNDHVLCSHLSRSSGVNCAQLCPSGEQDSEADGICTPLDNCPNIANPDQRDSNGNDKGDACDAFLETKQGSIYARRVITTPLPTGITMATYCILTSVAQQEMFLAQYRPTQSQQCTLPKDELVARFRLQQYSDSIALLQSLAQQTLRTRLDIGRLVKGVTPVLDVQTVATSLTNQSGGQIIYVQSDLTVNEPITIPARRGAVTVIVEGELTFGPQAEIVYATEAGIPLRQLASLAWIVLGDININPAVTDLAGAFFASGKIASGDGPQPLTVQGLMAARSFDFDREYVAPESESPRGAEQIIYDGRAALNPPPGLTDLVKTLPTFRTVAPR